MIARYFAKVPRRSKIAERPGLGDDSWHQFEASARQIEGDCQTICQSRLGPEAELLGGTARISDRYSDFTRSCRAVVRGDVGLVQLSHVFGEGTDARALARADVEAPAAAPPRGHPSPHPTDRIPN